MRSRALCCWKGLGTPLKASLGKSCEILQFALAEHIVSRQNISEDFGWFNK